MAQRKNTKTVILLLVWFSITALLLIVAIWNYGVLSKASSIEISTQITHVAYEETQHMDWLEISTQDGSQYYVCFDSGRDAKDCMAQLNNNIGMPVTIYYTNRPDIRPPHLILVLSGFRRLVSLDSDGTTILSAEQYNNGNVLPRGLFFGLAAIFIIIGICILVNFIKIQLCFSKRRTKHSPKTTDNQ